LREAKITGEQEAKEKPRTIKIVSKSKKHRIEIDHLNERGSTDTKILKKSVIFNMCGMPKMYAKDSLFFLSADGCIRKPIITIIESK
jgi:hypothetical protein